MKREDLREFAVETAVAGEVRTVQFTRGDVIVGLPALIIHGVGIEEAWQIIEMLGEQTTVANEDEPCTEPDDDKAEAAPPPPPVEKKKRKSKAQKKAEEKNSAALARDDSGEETEREAETRAEAVGYAEDEPKKKKKKKKTNGKREVAGIDLEQFKSASGLRELVGDFKEAGVESKEDVVQYCTELQGMGLKCLHGVNIERRVANLWAMVA